MGVGSYSFQELDKKLYIVQWSLYLLIKHTKHKITLFYLILKLSFIKNTIFVFCEKRCWVDKKQHYIVIVLLCNGLKVIHTIANSIII